MEEEEWERGGGGSGRGGEEEEVGEEGRRRRQKVGEGGEEGGGEREWHLLCDGLPYRVLRACYLLPRDGNIPCSVRFQHCIGNSLLHSRVRSNRLLWHIRCLGLHLEGVLEFRQVQCLKNLLIVQRGEDRA